jgi:hypothetical protein
MKALEVSYPGGMIGGMVTFVSLRTTAMVEHRKAAW